MMCSRSLTISVVLWMRIRGRGRRSRSSPGSGGSGATAGFIDLAFEGNITLELSNVGRMPVALHPNMRVCQISFEPLTSPAERPYGAGRGSKYQGQVGPTASRIHRDTR